MVSNYDRENLRAILLNNLGDWYDAHLMRFLNAVLFKADAENRAKLLSTFTDECAMLYRYYGWPQDEIDKAIEMWSNPTKVVCLSCDTDD